MTLRPEIELLLQASRPGADCPPRGDRDLDEIDWAFVIDTAYRHRVAALIGVGLGAGGWFEPESRQDYVRDAFHAAYALNERRNRILLAESAALVRLLQEHGIETVVRKGAYLTPAVYRDHGLRPMNDVDLFVDRSAAPHVAELLADRGYVPGTVDAAGKIAELTRRQAVFWNVHVNNLPTLHLPAADRCLDSIAVDICFDIFLPASGCRLPAATLLGEAVAVEVPGEPPIPVMRPEHFLLDVAAHLYKESTTLRYIEKRKHQRLLQYVDIAAVIATHPGLRWDVLVGTAVEAGAAAHAYFALANTERIFPGTVPLDALAELAGHAGVDADFLRSYGQVDLANPLTWSAADIVERLFTDERPAALSRSPI